ncbi:MAG: HEAT repeat domain-containing protein [Planctomycetaceae bacterium]|nr:HEAT repeat domain-containing protein [Planctomycetaceae bacterium]
MIVLLASLMLFPGEGTESVDSLLKKIGSDNPKEVRLAALEKLKEDYLGTKTGLNLKDPAQVRRALETFPEEKDIDVRRSLVLALGLGIIKYQFECPTTLVDAIDDADEQISANARVAVTVAEKISPSALPHLLKACDSDDHSLRMAGVQALPALAAKSPDALKKLKQLMKHPNVMVQDFAHHGHFEATQDFGPYVTYLLLASADRPKEPAPKTPDQKQAEEHKDMCSVTAAMKFYHFSRTTPKKLANELLTNLSHEDARIRQCTLRQLRAMCISSHETYKAIPKNKAKKAVAKLFEDKNEKVSNWAYWVDSLLDEGPPKDAPEKLKPLDEIPLIEPETRDR